MLSIVLEPSPGSVANETVRRPRGSSPTAIRSPCKACTLASETTATTSLRSGIGINSSARSISPGPTHTE